VGVAQQETEFPDALSGLADPVAGQHVTDRTRVEGFSAAFTPTILPDARRPSRAGDLH